MCLTSKITQFLVLACVFLQIPSCGVATSKVLCNCALYQNPLKFLFGVRELGLAQLARSLGCGHAHLGSNPIRSMGAWFPLLMNW
jgi:hypothetical protein